MKNTQGELSARLCSVCMYFSLIYVWVAFYVFVNVGLCKPVVVLEGIQQCLCLAERITGGCFQATCSEMALHLSSSWPRPPSKRTDPQGSCEEVPVFVCEKWCVLYVCWQQWVKLNSLNSCEDKLWKHHRPFWMNKTNLMKSFSSLAEISLYTSYILDTFLLKVALHLWHKKLYKATN